MAVTGYKTDVWLVKTVGVLLLPYCLLLTYLIFNLKRNVIIVMTIMMCCLGLAMIDFYYYFSNVIKWVYLIDGFFQVLFLAYWIFYIIRTEKR